MKYLIIILILAHSLFGENDPNYRKIEIPRQSVSRLPESNLNFNMPQTPRIGLVLSGGGARGFAHIGVLRAFEENNISTDLIVGSSMGSIVGGFFAAGYDSYELEKIMKAVEWDRIYNDETYRRNLFWSQKSQPRRHMLELRFDGGIPYIPSALTPGQKIYDNLYELLIRANFQSAGNFDRLKIPFRAVATDLISGERVVLKNGNLAEAITASVTFPLLFAPVEIDGMWLVDGGIKDNLPVDVALEENASLVIAVDVSSPLRKRGQMNAPWQIADQVTTIMMQEPTDQSRDLADILILPELGNLNANDFEKIDSLIDAGYKAALKKIAEIQLQIDQSVEFFWGRNVMLGKIAAVHSNAPEAIISDPKIQPGRDVTLFDLYRNLLAIYGAGNVQDVVVEMTGEPESIVLNFQVTYLPRIRSVQLSSNNILPENDLAEILNPMMGNRLNLGELRNTLDSLHLHFVRQGYPLTLVESVLFDSSQSLLCIKVDEGKIHSINISGNRKTKSEIILREFPMSEGDYFRAEHALQGIRNIYSSKLFDRVSLNVESAGEGYRLNIKVKEKKYFLMRLGGHASVERKARGFVEFSEDNLLGRDIKASVSGLIGVRDKKAEFNFFSVRLFNTLLTYRLSGYYSELSDRYYKNLVRFGNYLTIRRGLRFIVGQQIARLGSITAELRWDNVSVSSSESEFANQGDYKIRSLTLRSVVDKRDKLPFPDRGIYNKWFWETGTQKLLGGNISFTRFALSIEAYYPLPFNLNYHINFNGGSGDQTVPFSEFFTLGGMREFPGFYENEVFGRQLINFQNELRYQPSWNLPINLYSGLSYNVGAIWQTSEEPIRKKDFITSVAAFLAVETIFGPMEIVYGRLTNRRNVFYFSVGYPLY